MSNKVTPEKVEEIVQKLGNSCLSHLDHQLILEELVDECVLAQKQVTTKNTEESTLTSEKQAKTSPFTPEKVRELIDVLSICAVGTEEWHINKWLEQNQPEPVITCLTIPQKSQLVDFLIKRTTCIKQGASYEKELSIGIDHFLEVQKPSISNLLELGIDVSKLLNVEIMEENSGLNEENEMLRREIAGLKENPIIVGLSDEQVMDLGQYYYGDGSECDQFVNDFKFWQKTQTFAEPQIKQVPVGLSDEQRYSVCQLFAKNPDEFRYYVGYLRDYLDTQTFTQPSEAFKAAMEEVHIRDEEIAQLKDKLEQLKSQQFQPNWNDAPADAVEYAVFEYYTTKEGKSSKGETLHLEQRPKPTPQPQVEVGQVWKHEGEEYEVFNIIHVLVGDEWKEGIQCKSKRKDRYEEHAYVGIPTPNFISKFERVS